VCSQPLSSWWSPAISFSQALTDRFCSCGECVHKPWGSLPLRPCFRPSTMRDQLPPQFIDIAPRSPLFTRQTPSLDLSPQSILSEPLHFRSPADKLMDPPSAAVLVSIPENVEHDTHVWNALAAGKVMIDNGMYQLASRSFLHGIRLKPASPNVLCTLVSYNFVSRLLATLQAVASSAHGPSETSRISMLSYAAAISSVPNLAPEHVVLGMQLLASSQLNLGKYASQELKVYHFCTNLVVYLVCANMMKQLLVHVVLYVVALGLFRYARALSLVIRPICRMLSLSLALLLSLLCCCHIVVGLASFLQCCFVLALPWYPQYRVSSCHVTRCSSLCRHISHCFAGSSNCQVESAGTIARPRSCSERREADDNSWMCMF
jgi:hypothetical protein